MSTQKVKTDQYQIRLSPEFRAQLEEQARKDGDSTLATWLKRVLRKELQSRGIEPKG
jgi:predicted HicB family RNase H-like nuclease